MKPDRPSETALMVAYAQWFLSNDPVFGPWVPAESVAMTEAAQCARGYSPKLLKTFLGNPLGKALLNLVEQLLVPGLMRHLVLRKAWISRWAHQALETSEQLVCLASGLDTLPYRLAKEYPEKTVIEVDHPASMGFKDCLIEALAWQESNWSCMAADLAGEETLVQVLNMLPSYRAALKTLYIAEGLTMYLSETEVRGLFAGLKAASPEGGQVIFTALNRLPSGGAGFQNEGFWLKLLLNQSGEPLKWGCSPEEMEPFLASMGMTLLAKAARTEFVEAFIPEGTLKNLAIARGETVYWAAWDSQEGTAT